MVDSKVNSQVSTLDTDDIFILLRWLIQLVIGWVFMGFVLVMFTEIPIEIITLIIFTQVILTSFDGVSKIYNLRKLEDVSPESDKTFVYENLYKKDFYGLVISSFGFILTAFVAIVSFIFFADQMVIFKQLFQFENVDMVLISLSALFMYRLLDLITKFVRFYSLGGIDKYRSTSDLIDFYNKSDHKITMTSSFFSILIISILLFVLNLPIYFVIIYIFLSVGSLISKLNKRDGK